MPHKCNALHFSLEINRVYFSKSVRRPEVLRCTVLSRASTSKTFRLGVLDLGTASQPQYEACC